MLPRPSGAARAKQASCESQKLEAKAYLRAYGRASSASSVSGDYIRTDKSP
ncbi:MAG TPA: hypothetical protein O0W95_04985 [Methanocorpusculum sp.]|nr:hypothetical protein [Methanocorpusculum sp.]